MDKPDHAEELDGIVDLMVSEGPHDTFDKYWSLYKESVYIPEPEGVYFRTSQDTTYRNIVIAGDNRIVDIEADETSAIQAISISPYRTLSRVGLYVGSLATLPRTQGSLLTVVCRITGSDSLGPYWSAHTVEEVARLRKFARILVEAISF